MMAVAVYPPDNRDRTITVSGTVPARNNGGSVIPRTSSGFSGSCTL